MRELAPSGGRMRNRMQDKGWGREPNEGAGDWEMGNGEIIVVSSRSEEMELLRGTWSLDVPVFKPYPKPLGSDEI